MDYITAVGLIMDTSPSLSVSADGALQIASRELAIPLVGVGIGTLIFFLGVFLAKNSSLLAPASIIVGFFTMMLCGMISATAWQAKEIEGEVQMAFENTRMPCDVVLTAISSGEMQNLGPLDPRKLSSVCGRVAFLKAANSDNSRLTFDIRVLTLG